ncbi:MAG: DegV family protein [Anaerolineae bacterium]|jgi:DegV family protein with EDD domain
MANVRVITDITAYLEPDVITQHQITVLPVDIRFGEERFRISSPDSWDRFYQRISEGRAQSTEATVPASAFEEAYSRLNRETEEILVIPGSGKLSHAYAEAKRAARGFLGRCRIAVMDSMSASWGLGLVVQAAAEAATLGRSLDDIVRLVRGMLPHIYLIFFVERLDYLERGGRISPAQALLGTMLRIKPLLLVEDGEIVPLEKVRTRTLAIEKVADFVAEFAVVQRVVILTSPLDNEINEHVDELREHLRSALPDQDFPIIGYDPVLACHLGPEALGVVVYEGL